MSATTEARPQDDAGSEQPDHSGGADRSASGSLRPGPLGRVAGAAYRHRGRVVLAWLGALVIAAALSSVLGGQFRADYSAPGSDSKAAQQLLESRFPAQSGDTVDVVVHSDAAVTSPAV